MAKSNERPAQIGARVRKSDRDERKIIIALM